MAFDTNLAVRIATVLDNTGLKSADRGMKGLEKRAKSLGRTLGITLSTATVIAYGKASVKAFMEDEASATRLASAVKNLGLAYEQPAIDSYLQKLEASSAIADDSLRPALQALLTTTGSLSESQKILGIALDVSRGSGRELTQVTQDLAQAYVGNTRGLRKYNLGLTQAELKTMSFADVQARLTEQFSGSNAAYLDTYAGKLSILTVAAGNAQETIGKGLVDALVLAGGKDGDIQSVANAMQDLSIFTADVIRGIGVLAGKFSGLEAKTGKFGKFIKDLITQLSPLITAIEALSKLGADSRPRPRANRNVTGRSNVTLFDADAAKAKKLEAERLKGLKTQANLQKKQTAELKRQALTKKQNSLFDIEQIQLLAALQGKLTKEERLRAELQLALLTGNTTEADKLSQKLAMTIDSTGALARSLKDLPDANNPFKNWDAYLDAVLLKAKQVAAAGAGAGAGAGSGGGGTDSGAGGGAGVQTNAVAAAVFNNLGSAGASTRTAAEAARLYGGMGSSQPIIIQIDGKEIASAVQNQSLQGNDPLVNRLLGGFR